MYKGTQVSLNQSNILKKIRDYLKFNGRDETFIHSFENGYCSGISTVWLYAKWLQTQSKKDQNNHNEPLVPIPRDDYDWFQSTIKLIIDWQEPVKEDQDQLQQLESLPYKERTKFLAEVAKTDPIKAEHLKKLITDNQEIERFISQIQYFQYTHDYLPLGQGQLSKSLEDTKQKDRTLNKEYAIFSLFTLEQLKQLLTTENIIQEGKLIYIISHNHTTALFKEGNNFYYFDPNSRTGEVKETSIDKIAEFIFNAHGFVPNKPSPLGFQMFSFAPVPAKNKKKEEKVTAIYPRPKEILAKIKPTLTPIKGYANECSGLILAASFDDIESVQYFLEEGADINFTDKNGRTALMFAVVKDNADVVAELLKNPKIDTNIIDIDGRTALMMAEAESNDNVITELLKNPGIDINIKNKNGLTTLMIPASKGRADIVSELLKNPKIDLNSTTIDGNTALMRAAGYGHANVVAELLKNPGIDVNIKNKKGLTALMWAAGNGHANVVAELLKNPKINLNAIDTNGNTALMWAASNGYANVVAELLKNPGIDFNIKDKNNQTALDLAIKNNQLEVAKLLLSFLKNKLDMAETSRSIKKQWYSSITLGLTSLVGIGIAAFGLATPVIPVLSGIAMISSIYLSISAKKKSDQMKITETQTAPMKAPKETEEKIIPSSTSSKILDKISHEASSMVTKESQKAQPDLAILPSVLASSESTLKTAKPKPPATPSTQPLLP